MNFPALGFRRYSSVEVAAARWLIRRDSGLTPEEQAQFEQWLAADAEHRRAFASLDQTWDVLEQVHSLSQPGEKPDPDTLAPARMQRMPGHPRPSRASSRPIAIAAAATVVLALVGTWRLRSDGESRRTLATDVGGIRRIDLPDGSIAHLNTDSALTIQYSPEERRIRLHRGEAHFTVASDPRRPFYVLANDVSVRALGTAFNVRLQTGAIEVTVTAGQVRVSAPDFARHREHGLPAERSAVETGSAEPLKSSAAPSAEGRVNLREPRAPIIARWSKLNAGQRLLISVATSAPLAAAGESAETDSAVEAIPVTVPDDELQRALAWQNHRLEFVAVPLGEIAAEFNRYNRHKLVIADRRLAERCFGGTFAADGYETLVHLLEENHGVVVRRGPNETVLKLGEE